MVESKKASLTVLGGPRAHAGCELPDEGTATIGSGDGCTLQLDLPEVGALHAAVMVSGDRVTVIDGGSGRPVYVNDNPVEPSGTQLRNGDILWLGAPGDAGVVMLQCILPRRAAATVAEPTPAAEPEPAAPAPAEPTPDIETTALYLDGASAASFVGAPEPVESEQTATIDAVEPDVEAAMAAAASAAEPEPTDDRYPDAVQTLPAAEPVAGEAGRDPLILEGDAEAAEAAEAAGEGNATLLAVPGREVVPTYEIEPTAHAQPLAAPSGADESSTLMFRAPVVEPPEPAEPVHDEFEDETLADPGGFESETFEASESEPGFVEPTVVGAVTEIDHGAPTIVEAQEPTAFEVPAAGSAEAAAEVEFQDETAAYVPTGEESSEFAPPAPEPFYEEEPATLAPQTFEAPEMAPPEFAPPPVEPPAAAPPRTSEPTPPPFTPTPRPHPSGSMGPTRREVAHGTHTPVPGRAAHPPAVRATRGGSRTGLLVAAGLAGVVALAGVGYVAWRLLAAPSGPTPQPTPVAQATPVTEPPVATPEPVATATPEMEPTATPAPTVAPTAAPVVAPGVAPTPRPTPTPTPTPTPRATPTPAASAQKPVPTPPPTPAGPSPAQQAAAQALALAEQAEQALAARQFDAAIGHADAALRLEPGNARASAARTEATHRRDLARRRFTPGRTAVETQKAEKGGGLAGFDAGDADLRKAPDFQGRIEFEMAPASGIEPGAAWTLRAYVVNEGKKPIRVQGVTIATNASTGPSGGPVAPKTREIAPQQRALIGEATGTWKDGTTAWSTEVTVTANKGDSLRNTLTWR